MKMEPQKVVPKRIGLLPHEFPGILATIGLGFQHFIAIFPATVLVPILTGFNVSVTLFASGLATLAALAVNRFRIPLYYGSSFSAIAAVAMVVKANGGGVDGVRVAQVGIFVAGIVQVLAGYMITKLGPQKVYHLLPARVTGPVAMIIAYALAATAIDMASGSCCGFAQGNVAWWTVAIVTCLATVFWSVLIKRGLLGMLPILGGATIGYLASGFVGLLDFTKVGSAQLFRFPQVTLPAFTHPGALAAMVAIVPVVIATIPESLAHLLQIGAAVDQIAKDAGKRSKEDLTRLTGLNQISDGVGDLVTGFFGGAMGTNYGETVATVVVSRAATVWAVAAAAVIAILSSFSGHLEAIINTIPAAVTGGLALYLFGAFGVVGIKMLQDVRGDLLEPKNLAVISLILIIGIGGGNKWGGSMPIPLTGVLTNLFPGGIPAIALAALVGILLNAIITAIEPNE